MTSLPIEQLGPRSWAIGTRHVGGKVGVIVGAERTLVVDAGADPTEGAAVAAAVTGVARGPVHVVLTHGHWDHVRGLYGMGGVQRVLVHEDAWPSVRSQIEIARRAPGAVDGSEPVVTTFDAPLSVDLGGVTVELIDTPGHAPGAVCVSVAEEAVLFGGDTVVTAIPPVFADGHSTILERTLRRLAERDIEIAVPGHGRVVRGRTPVGAALERTAQYLAGTREQVGHLFGPHDADGVAAMLTLRDMNGFDEGIVPTDELALRHDRMVRALIGELGLRPVIAPST